MATIGAAFPLAGTGISGSLALNNVAGVGNQQGNNLSTAAEQSPGANAVENDGRQTLVDNGKIDEEDTVTENLATVDQLTGGGGSISGAVAINNAAGVGNQQQNNVTLAH
jgi:hypothetical protein